jgi:hypothetical protein
VIAELITWRMMNYKVERTGWPSGPWDTESDRVQWQHKGIDCLILRTHMGNWCGYAAVTEGHPLFGKDYEDVDLHAHGGLTYANKCQGNVCHVPEPGQPDNVWWFGFDCAHCFDYLPAMHTEQLAAIGVGLPNELPDWLQDVYRTQTYVMLETEQLAEQLIARA